MLPSYIFLYFTVSVCILLRHVGVVNLMKKDLDKLSEMLINPLRTAVPFWRQTT